MFGFRVEQRALNASAIKNREIANHIFSLQLQLESILNNLNGQAGGYDRIKRELKNVASQSVRQAKKAEDLAKALDEIGLLYSHTEGNLTDSADSYRRAVTQRVTNAASPENAPNNGSGSAEGARNRHAPTYGGGGSSGGGGASRSF